MSHDLGDLGPVSTIDLVDLFRKLTLALHQTGVKGVLLLEALQIGDRDAVVQVVGTRQQDVLTRTWGLVCDDRLERGIEEERLDPSDHLFQTFTIL